MQKRTIINTISNIYAKSLLEIAETENLKDLYRKQLSEILEVLNSSEDLCIVMANSSISVFKKLEILDGVLKGRIDDKLLNFLKILVEKGRFNELEAINEAFCHMLEEKANRKTVEVFSPIELNFENKTNVLFKLEHKLGCEVVPVWKIDETLIAGLAFKFDDTVIDTSIRAKLEDLSKTIAR